MASARNGGGDDDLARVRQQMDAAIANRTLARASNGIQKRKLLEAVKDRILTLRQQGVSWAAIAKFIGELGYQVSGETLRTMFDPTAAAKLKAAVRPPRKRRQAPQGAANAPSDGNPSQAPQGTANAAKAPQGAASAPSADKQPQAAASADKPPQPLPVADASKNGAAVREAVATTRTSPLDREL